MSCSVAVLVLAPYAAVFVPFQAGLVLQLGIIVAALFGGWAGLGREWRAGRWPRPVSVGLALYAGAAGWGIAVGITSGNPFRYVTSQATAMLLLPLAAIAFAAGGRSLSRQVAAGVAAAMPLALAMHGISLAVPSLGWADPLEPFRLLLRNDASLAGAAPLLLLVLLGWWLEHRSWWALAALVGAGVLVAGIMSRGGWVTAVVGGVGVALVMVRQRRRLVGMLLLGVGGVAAAWGVLTLALRHSERVLYPGAAGLEGTQPPWVVAASTAEEVWLPLAGQLDAAGAGLEVHLVYAGPAEARASLLLVPEGGAPSEGGTVVSLFGAGVPSSLTMLIPLGGRPQRLDVGLAVGEGEGVWSIAELRVVALPTVAHLYLRQFNRRLGELVRAGFGPQGDRNLAYRARELEAIRARWHLASVARKLVGHGLGATFEFPNSSWDDEGRRTTVPIASYIHNFYVFLAFKLGLAGAAALAGLLAILGWACRDVGRRHAGERWPAVVLAVGLATYLLWSVASPEIYDFRVAPLWGMLITLAASRRGEAIRGTRARGEPGTRGYGRSLR